MVQMTTEMPQEGQFVAVWEYQGKIWSDTYRWNIRGALEIYNQYEEEGLEAWIDKDIAPDEQKNFNDLHYIILEEIH